LTSTRRPVARIKVAAAGRTSRREDKARAAVHAGLNIDSPLCWGHVSAANSSRPERLMKANWSKCSAARPGNDELLLVLDSAQMLLGSDRSLGWTVCSNRKQFLLWPRV